MKKYELNLSAYGVEVSSIKKNDAGEAIVENGQPVMEVVKVAYPLRENYASWLRSVGIFKSANEIAVAAVLAKEILNCKDDTLKVDEQEAAILKKMMDRLVELTSEGKASVGGETHIEAILRVVNMKEIEG